MIPVNRQAAVLWRGGLRAAIAIGCFSLAHSVQAQDVSLCKCMGGGCSADTCLGNSCNLNLRSPIDNFDEPKGPDLILCATDACPEVCEAIWANYNTERVSTVQDAIDKIDAAFIANGGKINVVVDGHGTSGVQCFGPDVVQAQGCGTFPTCNGACPAGQWCIEADTNGNQIPDACRCAIPQCIGNNEPFDDKKQDFINGVTGELKTLHLLGCSAAADPKGAGFLAKLAAELEAKLVKGYSGTNWARGPVTTNATVCGAFPNCGSAENCRNGCPAGQVCVEVDTNSDQTPDACRCGTPTAKAGGYETEGEKIEVPTVSTWGLAIMTLLVVTAATVVITRRNAVA